MYEVQGCVVIPGQVDYEIERCTQHQGIGLLPSLLGMIFEDSKDLDNYDFSDVSSITCPQCKKTSYHPEDVKEQYCGNCRQFHRDMSK